MEFRAAARALSNQRPWLLEEMRLGKTIEASFAGYTDRHLMDLSRMKILVMQLTEWASPYHTGQQLDLPVK